MIAIRVTPKTEGSRTTARFEVGISPDQNPFAFTFDDAGELAMPDEAWMQVQRALGKGTRRPMILMIEQG